MKTLKPLRRRFEEVRENENIPWEVIEQDYILSWVLAGIAGIERLQNSLVFKGGTALKKCYFGHYRFSQDLDFSVRGAYPQGDTLEILIKEACAQAQYLLEEQDQNVALRCERYQEKKPHPEGQEAFTILAQYPWQREFHTRVMVEVTIQEKILLEPDYLPLIHTYGEELKRGLFVYRLEEIIAEKICAILQYARKLHEQGWGRSRARDYYDLWRILTQFHEALDVSLLPSLVVEKSKKRKVVLVSPHDLFSDKLLKDLDASWFKWMAPIVPQLPDQTRVLEELRPILQNIWERG